MALDVAAVRVSKAFALYRLGRVDEARTTLPQLGALALDAVSVTLNAVSLYALLDQLDQALELSYRLVCAHENDVAVLNRYLAIAFRARRLRADLFTAQNVAVGSVVVLESDDKRRLVEITETNDSSAHWSPMTAQSANGAGLLGATVGSDQRLGEEVWRVTGIESKYARLSAELLETVHQRFAGEAAARPLKLDAEGRPQVEEEFARLAKTQDRAAESYRAGFTIQQLADLIGEDIVDAWYLLLSKQFGEEIHVPLGEMPGAIDEAGVVVDLLGLIALYEISALEALREKTDAIVLAQSTIDGLVRARDERKYALTGGVKRLVRVDGRPDIVEGPSNGDAMAATTMYTALLEWCYANASIRGVPLDRADGRGAMSTVYSESATDSVLLAATYGGALVAEDARVIAFAEKLGVAGVGSIGVVRWLRGLGEEALYEDAMAQMATWGYPVDVDAEVLLRATVRDGWKRGRHLNGTLRALLGRFPDGSEVAGVVARYVRELWTERVLGGSRQEALIGVLDFLNEHELFDAFEKAYVASKQTRFLLLPTAEGEVDEVLREWKKARRA